jgi:thiol-disulfide isomerase/thioredoxin
MKLLLSLNLMGLGLAAQTLVKLAPLDQASYPQAISAQHGTAALVNFWATRCVLCGKEMPQLIQLSRKLAVVRKIEAAIT